MLYRESLSQIDPSQTSLLLGVFSAVAPEIAPELSFFSRQSVEQAIAEKLKRGLQENLETFKGGYDHGRSLLQRV